MWPKTFHRKEQPPQSSEDTILYQWLKTFHRRNSDMMCVTWLWCSLEDSFKGLGYRAGVHESTCLACRKLRVQFPALHTLGVCISLVVALERQRDKRIESWKSSSAPQRIGGHPLIHVPLYQNQTKPKSWVQKVWGWEDKSFYGFILFWICQVELAFEKMRKLWRKVFRYLCLALKCQG